MLCKKRILDSICQFGKLLSGSGNVFFCSLGLSEALYWILDPSPGQSHRSPEGGGASKTVAHGDAWPS